MSFAKRFNIQTSLEQIEEEEVKPVEESTVATNEAPVDTSTTVVDEAAPADTGEVTINPEVIGEVDQQTGSVDVEGAGVVVDNQDEGDAEQQFYEQEISSGLESIAALEALQTAVQKAHEAKLAQEAYTEFVKIGVEAICKKHAISKDSKHYPALENLSEDLKSFSGKLSTGLEAIKAKLEEVKAKAKK